MTDLQTADKTLEMSVANTGFMLDRLGQDCSPLQFLRELTQNALEAIQATPNRPGSVIWDVDWNQHSLTGAYNLSIIDTGVGMTGPDMIEYINKLSSSAREQSHEGNFGVGAKVAAATRNHAGLLYLSWKRGKGTMIHLWRDPQTGVYGLRQFEKPDGSFDYWTELDDDVKPSQINQSGTMVILLGNDQDANTMAAPANAASPSRWVTYYLNTRYFQFPDKITVRAREGWEHDRSNTDSNILRTLTGQREYLMQHSDRSGEVELTGAKAHWWILKDESAMSQYSGVVASSGHVAALYQDELYEMVTGRAGSARLQHFGVIFGYNRVVIYIEPEAILGQSLTSNTARTQLLVDGNPLPWVEWAAEFRAIMPEEIRHLMEQVAAGVTSSDHREAIRERLKQVRDLFRLSRYRPDPMGKDSVDPGSLIIGNRGSEPVRRKNGGRPGRRRVNSEGAQAGSIYALFQKEGGTPAERVRGQADPEVIWLTVEDGTRNPPYLDDRAARYLRDQNRLMINGDFRVFTDFVDRWVRRYGDIAGARDVVRETVREWFEQTLIETVMGTRALRGSREWNTDDLASSLSEEALTAAVMPRYHIEMAVKRALGARLRSLKE